MSTAIRGALQMKGSFAGLAEHLETADRPATSVT